MGTHKKTKPKQAPSLLFLPLAVHAMPTSYSVEHAKSGRAKCKRCKEPIAKDSLRIGSSYDRGDFVTTGWRHLACQVKPKALGEANEIEGYDELEDDEKALVDLIFEPGYKPAGGTPKKKKTKKRAADDDDGASPSKKKRTLTPEERELQEASVQFQKMKVAELKAILELNMQIRGGKKAELVARCADGFLYGALPKCPSCHGGNLKPLRTGVFTCAGYFDDDVFVPCRKQFKNEDLDRIPWKMIGEAPEEADDSDEGPVATSTADADESSSSH